MSTEKVIVDPMNQAIAKLLGVVTDVTGKVVDIGIDAGEKAVTLLSAEIPDVIKQLLFWKFTESILHFLLAIFLLVVYFVLEKRTFSECKKLQNEDAWMLYFFPGSIVRVVLGTVIFCLFNLTWIKIWIAPKVYLIEYVSNLLGGK